MATFVPEGIMTALVTPFHPDGSFNWQAQADLIEYQVGAGVSAVVVTAGSGEYVTLRSDERAEVARQAAVALRGRAALVAGILAPDTGSAVDASLAAKEAGAQAILLLTPYYIAPSPAGLVMHFRQVADAVGLPIILYNNPGRTGINLDVAVLEQLAEIPSIVAIKECDRDLGRVALKIKRVGSRIAFLCGDDDLCLQIWSIAPVGAIMASTNVLAPWVVSAFNAVKAGDWDTARDLFFTRVLPFFDLFMGPDHPGPLKQMVGLAGFHVGTGRPPLNPVSEDRLAELARELRSLGLIELAHLSRQS